ncbi:hypothetical protein KTD13_16750 [Burkholderia multivorans]|uniref:hypothetical protein n=1 Tax=Burkholderia multivorans TaxID=87883 RepID=UPI001C22C6C9|nr:hypothetical protein [Burkholderia multivorans]MBU9262007.1 hypothetical protein [Burkholderia multivorans]
MKLTIEDLETLTIHQGGHESPDEGHCLLEVVSMFAGEQFSDSPKCVDPILAQFGRSWNDGMRSDEERAQLKIYITRLPGTNKGPEHSQKRGWMAMDWIVRTYCAAWAAARAAARDAAWDASGAKLEPTVKQLQASAHDLFSRMIDAE